LTFLVLTISVKSSNLFLIFCPLVIQKFSTNRELSRARARNGSLGFAVGGLVRGAKPNVPFVRWHTAAAKKINCLRQRVGA
jgi:hypothetical protein